MASEIIRGLFGFDPQEKAMQQEQADMVNAYKIAQLDPMQQASFLGMQGINMAKRGFGAAANKLFGIQDPEMQENALLEQGARELYSSGVDPLSTQGLSTLMQRLNAAGARPQTLERLSMAMSQAQMREAKLGTEQSKQRENLAQAAIAEMNLQDRQKLAQALSQLPPDATDEERMAVVMQFARNPDVLIQGINQRAAIKDRSEAQKEAIRMQTEARLEAARLQGANAAALEAIRQEGRMALQQMRMEEKKERAEEKKYEGFVKSERAAEGFIDNSDNLITRLNNVKARINNKTAGLVGGALSKAWATEAQAVKLELESIASNIGFDKLTEMRQNSPTGGALGSVSDYEGKQLRNAVASLENTQDPAVLRKNIDAAIDLYTKLKTRISNNLEQDRRRFRMGEQPSKNITVDY